MNWFYAEGSQQKGPVSDTELAALAQQGAIKPETMVWREGMPDWQPLLRVRPDLAATTGSPIIAGMAVPEQSKDLLVQQLREGVLVESSLPGNVQYVGFWWRVLARFIDGLVVAAAGCVLIIPIAMVFGVATAASGNSDPGSVSMAQIVIQLVTNAISLGLGAFYYTWMTGKYGATLGKQALGFKVVTEDGGKVSYARAFGRWAAHDLLNTVIMWTVMVIPVALVVFLGLGIGFADLGKLFDEGNELMTAGWVVGIIVALFVGMFVGAFPWWMAGFDSEKRALHDRVCATRVVRK